MAKRPIVRQGDRTTHGGTVLTGDPTFILLGRQVARVGDSVSCPRCKRTSRIVTGAPTMFDGQLVARQDDLTDCGAKLIASQFTDTYDDGTDGPGEATLASKPAVESPAAQSERTGREAETEHSDGDDLVPCGIRFQAIDPTSGSPLAKRPYIVTREDGAQHGGLTDAQGYTEVIETSTPEQVAVHFMFADPDGQAIDREDLLP
jgi:uncharacterized Zn-binding protein involved in type VI secretion